MRKAVSICLVENEQTENRDGGRIAPALLPPKTDDEPEFDCAVAEQIEGGNCRMPACTPLSTIGPKTMESLVTFSYLPGVYEIIHRYAH